MAEMGKPHLTPLTFSRRFAEMPHLREGGERNAFATYCGKAGTPLFAFCPEGLLIDPEGDARLIAYGSIADAGYRDHAPLVEFKTARQRGETPDETLLIRLHDGGVLEFALNRRPDNMSERLSIAPLIERIVRKTCMDV